MADETAKMFEKTVNMKHLAIFAIAVIAFVLASSHYLPKKTDADSSGELRRRETGANAPDKIPVTGEMVVAAGGFSYLSQAQQSWVRGKYLHDLAGLEKQVYRRRLIFISRGQEAHVVECDSAIKLLRDAQVEVRAGSDPTLNQPLIDACIQALSK
jgi:hypothetical protein